MTPAQFLMIGIPGSETLLRRPYSVCGLPGTFGDGAADGLQVLYKVFGKGTALLASLALIFVPGAPLYSFEGEGPRWGQAIVLMLFLRNWRATAVVLTT